MVDFAMTDAATPPAAKATTTATFSADVIAESTRTPVLVHFHSARAEACRTVQAALEKAVQAAGGRLKLVTMDVDTQPQIAARLGVRGVPAVYAFQRGQPIDGFMGALPDAEIKGFIERLVGPLQDSFEEDLAEAESLLTAGDAATAADIFSAILEQEPDHLVALGGLIRALIVAGDLDAARGVLDQVPEEGRKDKALVAAQTALELAEQASSLGDLADLERRVAADPDDHQAQFDLALGLNGRGQREQAADVLLNSIKRDRNWNDGAARKQLLQFFEAWGLMDPVTLAARRKLSTLLFA